MQAVTTVCCCPDTVHRNSCQGFRRRERRRLSLNLSKFVVLCCYVRAPTPAAMAASRRAFTLLVTTLLLALVRRDDRLMLAASIPFREPGSSTPSHAELSAAVLPTTRGGSPLGSLSSRSPW